MSNCSINGIEFNIVYSEEEKNILKVNSKKEIFFEVFECSIFENDSIVLEQIGTWKDLPLVTIEFIKENKKYTCEAVLVEDGTTEFTVNEDNLIFLESIQKENKEENKEENTPSDNKVNEDVKLEINHTYDEKIKEYEDKKFDFLNELELQFENKISNLKEDISVKLDDFFEKLEDKKKVLIDEEIENISFNLNEKFNLFKKEVNELSDFNRNNIDGILENKIDDIDNTVKLFLDNLTENYNNKFDNNDKKVTASLLEINSIRNKLKKYYEKNEEKFNELFKLEEKLVNQDDYSDKNNEIFEFINEELERINNKFIYISEEENKKYNDLLATVSKTDVVEYKTILKEKIQDVELNLVKEELKNELSSNFKNEIISLKRYAEMSAGGGTNAVQYANGGTMNGNLNITQNILSGGVNLDQIFSTESSSVCAQDLQGVTNLGNTTTNSISSSGTIFGNIGDFTTLNALTANFTQTIVSTTSALSVVNDGTGPALYVQQSGAEPVAHFIDKDGDDIVISDNGNLGIGTFNPLEKLTVVGNISTIGNLFIDGLVDGRDIAADGLAIDNLESDVVYLSGEIDSIDVEIDNLFTEVDYLSGEIDSNTLSITNLETDVDYLSGEIDSNTLSITNLETDVDYLSGEIDINSTGITNLETDVTYLSGEIDIKAPIASPSFTGNITIPDKIIHTGDTNTFINFSDADQIDLEAGGSRIVRINEGFNVSAKTGASGSNGSDGGDISLTGGTGGQGTSNDGGNGGNVTIDGGIAGLGNDDDGEGGVINIGTTNASRICIGNNSTIYTVENDSSFRTAIGAAGTADPDFTGNVSLSRIDGNNDILIEPNTRTEFANTTGYNITIEGGEGNSIISTGDGGDVNIQGGASNATGVDGDVNIGISNTNQVNIGSITDVESEINNIESNVTYLSGEIDEKAPLASPSFTGTITSSGLLDFGHRTSNDVLIRGESDSNDITLIRAASNSDAVGVSLKYIGSGSGDENLFEITTDGGGSFKIDNSGDVGINTAPVDGIDLTVGSFRAKGKIIGGSYNSASGNNSTVVGGSYNSASGSSSFVGSGGGGGGAGGNNASGNYSFVGGGSYNTSTGNCSFIGGGICNEALSAHGFVGGGCSNSANDSQAFVGGGQGNTASGTRSSVVGGLGNTASGTCSFVGGGRCNCATGNHSIVLGGYGYSGNIASGTGSAIIGNSGYGNRASGNNAVTLGGAAVQAIGYRSVVIGGYRSYARCSGSVIINSCLSNNRGIDSTIIGGTNNCINTFHNESFIIGTNLKSNAACTTFMNNLSVQGSLSAGNGITSNGDLDVCGTTNVTKITLTLSSFMTETDSFTLGASHKGATVLLQNTSPITITIPSLVAGHVTTFIAETINDVTFTSGSGLSGLNSFNGASSMLGQFAQAQVIFKTSEYAFLGGQIT